MTKKGIGCMGVARQLVRASQKARGEFKGRTKIRGHHNYLRRKAEQVKTGSMMECFFRQILGQALRSIKN
jgi:hypothetical protein